MTGYLTTYDGRRFALPEAVNWRFQYGCGTPCDSFRYTCAWGTGTDGTLADAVEFEAEEGGETVFHGRVDEYELSWDGTGGRLLVSGRGMAALLLDNEARPADYQVATLEDILRDHVRPYGVRVEAGGSYPPVSGFSVESGSSEWQVLCDFASRHGGAEPRFDRAGALVLAPWADGAARVMDDGAVLTGARLREKRYGALSEVLVRDRVGYGEQRVVDQGFFDRGGRCRRVVTLPGWNAAAALRSSGQERIRESGRERIRLEITCGGTFLAWPGELMELRRTKPGLGGIWRVAESETGVDTDGGYTRLVLGEK